MDKILSASSYMTVPHGPTRTRVSGSDDLALDLSGGCGLEDQQGALWLIPAHGTARGRFYMYLG
jgi:hypothetical protein